MRISYVLSTILLFIVMGCNGRQNVPISGLAAREPATASMVRSPSSPVIVITDSSVFIDGKEVWLGATIESWKMALPQSPRCISQKGSIKICLWDDLGLEVGTDRQDWTRVAFINITLVPDVDLEGFDSPTFAPRGVFVGTLELDGVHVDKTVQFSALRAKVRRSRDLRCGGNDCGHPTGGFSEAASLYLKLSSKSEHGFVQRLSIDCIDTKSCAALVPLQIKVQD